ncbi:MAG: hypothetical protein QHH43_02840 [Candidatus Saccharicenans sp.]|jgi:hypothetical protein|nr:hypothetical protein [Candidatus Saccharicenans sp.]MDH7574681.1 hypothetical protein [Candidatus Saccharicenans sp.]
MARGANKRKRAGRRPARQPSGQPAWGLPWPDCTIDQQLPAELLPFLLCEEQKPAFQKSMLSRIIKSLIN